MIEAWNQFASLATAISLTGVAISSAFAAFFGALGAQRIIAKGMVAEKLESELNTRRAAINTCYTILTAALTFKKQHITELKCGYEGARHAAETTKSGDMIHLAMDFRSLSLPRFPVNLAEQLFFHELRLTGRASAAAGMLLQSLELLADSVRRREELINEIRKSELDEIERIRIFLGNDDKKGRDERYPNLVEAIYLYCDDAIFFSLILEFDLVHTLPARKSRWRRSATASSPSRIKWREGIAQYMPNASKYADWLAGYPDEGVPEVLDSKESESAPGAYEKSRDTLNTDPTRS